MITENLNFYRSLQNKTKWHRKQDRKRVLKAAKKMCQAVVKFDQQLMEADFHPEWMNVGDFGELRSSIGPYLSAIRRSEEQYFAESYPRNASGQLVVHNITLEEKYPKRKLDSTNKEGANE